MGPRLSEIDFGKDLGANDFMETLGPVYETIHRVKKKLPAQVPLIGFAGAPWTLAFYMLEEEGGSRDFAKAKTRAFENRDKFEALLRLLVTAITAHLEAQVEAGADAIQIFDTWAGLCPALYFEKWVLSPTRKIVTTLRRTYPDLPIIGFPKGIGSQLKEYGEKAGFSALSLDA